VAHCYRCSMVCVSVCLSVGHKGEPYINGWTDRIAVWVWTQGPQNHLLGEGPDPPRGRGNFGVIPSSKMHCNSESAKNG